MNRRQSAAFTLIELLVVIIIIGVIIAITLPALGLARTAAKKAATDAMMHQINQAVGQFQTDNRRMPGYFSARDVGSSENAMTFGLSAMQNVMLDLSGFQQPTSGGVMVGPTNATQIQMDPKSLGLPGQGNTKAYWTADIKHLVVQDPASGQVSPTMGNNNAQIPAVVDEWGDPLLAWVADDAAIAKINPSTTQQGINQFAAITTTSNAPPTPSFFYWASNSCYLSANGLGKRGQNQSIDSLIGGTSGNPTGTAMDVQNSLAGMLGNANYPWKDPNNPNMPYAVPSVPRAPFILQSAGADGVFVSKNDRGAKQFASPFIDYRLSFAPNVAAAIGANNQWADPNGHPKNIDVMQKFDDLLAVGGN